MDGGTNGHDFVWVDALHWVFAEEFLYALNDGWHTGHTTDHDNFGDIRWLEVGILQCTFNWTIKLCEQWLNKLFEFCASERELEVLRTIFVSGDIWKVDFDFRSRAELFLCLLCFVLDALHSGSIVAEINTSITLEAIEDMVNNLVIEIFTAKVSIAICRLYLKDAITELENGNIESTATKVEDDNLLVFVLFETVSESGCSRLVNNTANLETSNLTSILRSLTLRIIKVGRNRNNCFSYFLAKESLCIGFNLAENHCGNFFWGVLFTAKFNSNAVTLLYNLVRRVFLIVLNFFIVELTTNQTLNTINRVLWISNTLALCNLANETFILLCNSDNGWRSAIALTVRNNLWLTGNHIGKCRVGRTEVDTDNFAHLIFLHLENL